ncbi:MAG: hypothetical protein ABII23_01045 [bacterium]
MRQKILILFYVMMFSAIIGCDRHPFKNTSALESEGLLPEVSSEFIIYDDQIKTGGNLFTFPGGENQTVDLESRDNPCRGKKAICYSWNGKQVFDGTLQIYRHDYVGLDLGISQGSDDYDALSPRDITLGAYTKASFFVKGSLSANTTVKFEVVDDGNTATDAPQKVVSSLRSSWEKHEITGISVSDLTNVKDYFKVTFIYTQPTGTTTHGNGGTIYIDDIKLEQ